MQYSKKYCWGKMGPNEFDCAGFVWYVYHELFGIDINHNGYGKSMTTRQMTSDIGKLTLYSENSYNKVEFITPGSILFFHRQSLKEQEPAPNNYYPGHCGLYLGNSNFIQASCVKGKVIISNFEKNNYWKTVLVGSKDIISTLVLK